LLWPTKNIVHHWPARNIFCSRLRPHCWKQPIAAPQQARLKPSAGGQAPTKTESKSPCRRIPSWLVALKKPSQPSARPASAAGAVPAPGECASALPSSTPRLSPSSAAGTDGTWSPPPAPFSPPCSAHCGPAPRTARNKATEAQTRCEPAPPCRVRSRAGDCARDRV
jgi:hypothetical protein